MEPETPPLSPKCPSSSDVDTSRPFRSVKEAVAVFDERLLTAAPPLISQNNSVFEYQETPRRSGYVSSPSTKMVSTTHDDYEINDDDLKVEVMLRKLEAELEETKKELKLLKDRESETEIVLANLKAELHKSKSKLAEAEGAAAKVAAATRSNYVVVGNGELEIVREEAKRRELMIKRMEENNQTLAEILSISGEKETYFGRSKRDHKLKKKPIVPLIGDFFLFRNKNTSSNDDHLHTIYGAPAVYFN